MRLEREGEIALFRMEAGKANAVGAELLAGLDRLMDELEGCDAAALVLTGYERFFSAGLDLPGLFPEDRDGMRRMMSRFHDTMLRLFRCPVPVVAAMNGHAIAGGYVIALQADWRVLVRDGVRVGLSETQLGVGLPSVVAETLRFALPSTSLVPVALEGGLFDPEVALGLGLVDELASADDVLPRALEKARALASIPPEAYAQVKLGLRRPFADAAETRRTEDAEAWLDTWFSPGARERIGAAIERIGTR